MKKYSLILMLLIMAVLTGCKKQPVKTPTEEIEDVIIDETKQFENVVDYIINGDFESGDLRGWKTKGLAFTTFGVTTATHYWQDRPYNQIGNWHFTGELSAPERMTGEMNSNSFKVTRNGEISFYMGAAKDKDKVYVALCDAMTGNELERVVNVSFNDNNNYHLYKIDLNKYVDKIVYIKVVDNDNDGDFGFINVDNFVVNYY